MITAALMSLVAASVAGAATDSDGDGMPDDWEKRYGLNPTNATDAVADADQDGFTNLEEYKARTDPVGPCVDHALYVHKVVAEGTNRWIHFFQFGGKPVWVREGKPDGPIGGVPDWNNRKLWQRVAQIAIDDLIETNIHVIITFRPEDGKTNTWSVPFVGDAPRRVLKAGDNQKANQAFQAIGAAAPQSER